MKLYILGILMSIAFSGCAGYFNIGAEQGYCEEQGCDYSDAGVCGNPYDILKNKEKAKNLAYERINCNCQGAFDEKK